MSNDATRNENVDPAGIRAINPRIELQATLLFNGPMYKRTWSERERKPKGSETKDVRVWGRKLRAEVVRVGGGGGEGVMTTAATNHPEVTQREITLHPIRFKAGTGLAIPRRKSPP
ncbi:hypothetical protein ALC62_01515 [Cyphomyrmex costatus]|uniref:Uncharacterized protein n=1 Tax=Cyphomyrmex costatus TaxID=456900 RepID=A0A195D336_9HYME|nr:hypothetical protein ALC62_01515 [Cyphomyrmex costatus]